MNCECKAKPAPPSYLFAYLVQDAENSGGLEKDVVGRQLTQLSPRLLIKFVAHEEQVQQLSQIKTSNGKKILYKFIATKSIKITKKNNNTRIRMQA